MTKKIDHLTRKTRKEKHRITRKGAMQSRLSGGTASGRIRKWIFVEVLLIALAVTFLWNKTERKNIRAEGEPSGQATKTTAAEPIKWVDFKVSYEALCRAYEWDVNTHGTDHHVSWIDLLALTAAKTGGEFPKSALDTMEKLAVQLSTGEKTVEEVGSALQYFPYYKEAYESTLGGMVGEYQVVVENESLTENGAPAVTDSEANVSAEETSPQVTLETKYGLKAYFPLARGFDYTHYDDFGVGRTYVYKRKHLGHDMMGLTGTPIIAVESGIVEALGWNQYGGWRVGIRSFDGRRYYYYAHLRQNYPYAEGLAEGSIVTAGDVIGYMGHTGYSTKENVNNIEVTHLHWGLELVFDEARREQEYEIWLDVYPLTKFLAKHTQAVHKIEGTKEWIRSTKIVDPAVEEYLKKHP